MTGLIGRIVIAVVIAIVVGLLLTALLGPILVSLKLPLTGVIGNFFVDYGWALGIIAGLWHFFAGGFTWPTARPE